MKPSTQHPALRKRVAIIFIVAVLLPSLILCYLGLNSIQQEKHRQEQINLRNIESTLSLVISHIESDIDEKIRGILRMLPSFTDSPDRNLYGHIYNVKTESGLADDLFLLDKDFRISYPRTFLSGGEQRQRIRPIDNTYLESGERFEARENLTEALQQYTYGLEASTSLFERITFLMHIARCEFKAQRFDDSRQTYRRVMNLDNGRFLGREVPFILIAFYNAADITGRLESPRSAMPIMLDCYEFLLENFHRLTEAEYRFYITRIKEKVEANMASVTDDQIDRYHNLQTHEIIADRERWLRSLIDLQLLPEYQHIFVILQGSTQITYIRSSVGDTTLAIALKGYSDEAQRSGLMGVIFDETAFRGILHSMVESHNTMKGLSLTLISDDTNSGGINSKEEELFFLTAGFSSLRELFPDYKIGITSRDEATLDTLFMRSLILYYILFGGIIALIVFGIVFIFRDIYREEEYSKLKSEFISNLSHEIKTPIATIRTLAENLNEGWVHNPQKQRRYFHLINREAERLSHLAQNILDFSRTEARRKIYRKERVKLDELLQKVLQRFLMICDGEDTQLKVDMPESLPVVYVSPEGIEQALLNLLENAIKYSDTKREIDFCVKQSNNTIIIAVTDYGIGIPENEQKKIFEKFHRVESKDGRKHPGSGIGLSLVKEIVDIHNGRIDVKSELGKGSTFSLIIPINTTDHDD